MSYVLEYTRHHYYRMERIRLGIIVVLGVFCVVLAAFGLIVRSSYNRPTLRVVLSGAYNEDVNKLLDLQTQWAGIQNLHTNLVPYLQLTWAPQPATNILSALMEKTKSGEIPRYLTPKRWAMSFDGNCYVSNSACYAANISVDVSFDSDWFNVNMVDETRSCFSNLFENPVAIRFSGLKEDKTSGIVGASYKLRSFRNLPVSYLLSDTLGKVGKFRKEIRYYNLGKNDKVPETLDSALQRYPIGYKKYATEYDRSFDLGKVMSDRFPCRELESPEIGSVLTRWSEVADARFPWSRRKGKVLLDSENFVPHGYVLSLLEGLPKHTAFKMAENKLLGQCESLTNAFPVTDFYNLKSNNIYGTELAPTDIAISGKTDPSFEVEYPSKKSPSWFWVEFINGSSNQIAFATWKYTANNLPVGGIPLEELLSVATAISSSGRGYEISGFLLDFDDKTKCVIRAEFVGLVPLIYPVDGGNL